MKTTYYLKDLFITTLVLVNLSTVAQGLSTSDILLQGKLPQKTFTKSELETSLSKRGLYMPNVSTIDLNSLLSLGGMSGGGGHTLVLNPIGTEEVEKYIHQVRRHLIMYFNALDMRKKTGRGESPRIVSAARKNITNVINNVGIYISSDAPC